MFGNWKLCLRRQFGGHGDGAITSTSSPPSGTNCMYIRGVN